MSDTDPTRSRSVVVHRNSTTSTRYGGWWLAVAVGCGFGVFQHHARIRLCAAQHCSNTRQLLAVSVHAHHQLSHA